MIIDKNNSEHVKLLGKAATTLHGEVALRIMGSIEDGTYGGVNACEQWVVREWQAITQTQRDKRLSVPEINSVIDGLTIPDSELPPLADFAAAAKAMIDNAIGRAPVESQKNRAQTHKNTIGAANNFDAICRAKANALDDLENV